MSSDPNESCHASQSPFVSFLNQISNIEPASSPDVTGGRIGAFDHHFHNNNYPPSYNHEQMIQTSTSSLYEAVANKDASMLLEIYTSTLRDMILIGSSRATPTSRDVRSGGGYRHGVCVFLSFVRALVPIFVVGFF